MIEIIITVINNKSNYNNVNYDRDKDTNHTNGSDTCNNNNNDNNYYGDRKKKS